MSVSTTTESFFSSSTESFLSTSERTSSTEEDYEEDQLYQNWVQKFYQEYDAEKYAYFIILSLITLIIILINTLVLYIFYLERASIKSAQKYIISMSVNDLLVGILFISMEFSFFDVNTFLNPVACIVNSTFGYFILINSLITILVSSADRYWSIAFPVHYRMKLKDHIPNYILLASWSFSILNALISLGFTLDVNAEDGICRYDSNYVTVVTTIIPLICLLSIITLYILLYRTLKEKVFRPNVSIFSSKNIFKQILQYFKHFKDESDEDETCQKGKKLDKEVKTTIILFLTVTAAFAIMIPTFIIFAIFKIWPGALSNSTFYSCVCLFLLHPIINPLLYVYGISNIRKRGKIVLRKVKIWKTETEEMNCMESSQKNTQSSTV